MGITVNQIAEICGVSRTTVLRALNDQSRVSSDTKKRIEAVAKEHGYRPNLLARSLHKGRTMSLGVITLDVENYVFAQSLGAINREAERRGYFVNIALQGQDIKAETQRIQDLADRRMEGILISPLNQGVEFEQFLLSLGIPVVCIGNYVSDAISTVLIDEYQAARDAIRFITQKPYERIVFVCPPLQLNQEQNIFSHLRRSDGIRDEMLIHPDIELCTISGNDYLEQVNELMTKGMPRTAVLCSGDIYALRIMRALRDKDLKTPRDYGIMGFDDINVLQFIIPRLSTISTNVTSVAAAAVTELIEKIESPESAAKRIYLNYSIIPGETI